MDTVRISLECGVVCNKLKRKMGCWMEENVVSREVFFKKMRVAIACLCAYGNDPQRGEN